MALLPFLQITNYLNRNWEEFSQNLDFVRLLEKWLFEHRPIFFLSVYYLMLFARLSQWGLCGTQSLSLPLRSKSVLKTDKTKTGFRKGYYRDGSALKTSDLPPEWSGCAAPTSTGRVCLTKGRQSLGIQPEINNSIPRLPEAGSSRQRCAEEGLTQSKITRHSLHVSDFRTQCVFSLLLETG